MIDRSTFDRPFQYSEGIDTVVVNGRIVLDRGVPTYDQTGRALRRGR